MYDNNTHYSSVGGKNEMNPFLLMEQKKASFSQNEMLIYQSIRENPDQVTYKSISRLAEDCGVSQPTLSRFVKGLGYPRYQDFRADLISWLALRSEQEAQNSSHLAYFNTLYQVLSQVEKVLTRDTIRDMNCYIHSFRRVYATGLAKSYQPAQLLEILMRKKGYEIHAVPADVLNDLGISMSEQDLLIVFSVSANSQIMPLAQQIGGRLFLITANPSPQGLRPDDRTLVLPYASADPETSSISPIVFDIAVELLATYTQTEP